MPNLAAVQRRLVVLVVALSALVAGACSNTTNSYGRATEAAFLETCTARQSQPGPICACIYTEITQQIPFDRYVELDKQMQKDDKVVPDELIRIAADCSTRQDGNNSSSIATSSSSSSSSS